MNVRWTISKRKALAILFSILSIITLTLSLFTINPTFFVRADEEVDGKDKSKELVNENYDEYLEDDMENTYEIIGKFNEDIPKGREDTFRYIFSRVIQPGYINDVDKAYLSKGVDKKLLEDNNMKACVKGEPANLISSNCTIPNFSAQLGQSVMRGLYPSGVTNGERQIAKPLFNWGVPDGIPGGKVPVDPAQRQHKYTGLEIFGYNSSFTSYNGEWDDIMVSTEARLLANYGFMDTVNLTGSSIWNGVKTGISEFVDDVQWNPMTWMGSIIGAWEAGASSSLITVIDSSEANIVATRGWVRSGSSVGSSFYNVYTLTDKQIMDEATFGIADKFSKLLNSSIDENEELKDILSLEEVPVFNYDPELETEKSKKDREAAEKKNKEIAAYNKEVEIYNANRPSDERREKKSEVEVPDKVFKSEEDQFKDWKKDSSAVEKGSKNGIDCGDVETYDGFQECWAEGFEDVKKQNFSAGSQIISSLIKKVEQNLFKDDPYYDTSTAISHYVCADKEGNPKRDADGKYEYVYLEQNEGKNQSLNPACYAIRPVLEGGYFGNGYGKTITDTRHISNVPGASLLNIFPMFDAGGGFLQRMFMTISKFNAQLLNEMLNLSFSPLMEKLGITKIVKLTITSFKETIFFPMTATVVSIAALLMFWSAIQSRSLMRFFTSLLGMLLVFIFGVFLLNSPDKLIKLFDEVPNKVENYLANVILDDSDMSGLCSTNSKDGNAGVRSAQCNIWSTLVYQPWAYGQFGAGPNELYAYGYGDGFKNHNTDLVGDAAVKMGDGVVLNNWAAYQMQLMTSGTITEKDPKRPPGVTDKNIYRVVDAQAGPNGGELSDGSYFDTWTGSNGTRITTAFEASILSVTMLIVLGSFLLLKIQFTFIFSILFMALPIMLLYGLTPKGNFKLLEYSLTLLSLMIKRLMITVMISIMLVFLNSAIPQGVSSYNTVFFASMVIMGLFWMYKEEILRLFNLSPNQESSLMSGNAHEMKEAMLSIVPKGARQSMARTRAKAKGRTSGAIGGFMAGAAFANKQNMSVFNPKSDKFLTKNPGQVFGEMMVAGGKQVSEGMNKGTKSFTQREENKQLREGLTMGHTNKLVQDRVREKGASSIIEGDEVLEKELYLQSQDQRNLITRDAKNNAEDSKNKYGKIDKSELKNRKTQRAVRKASKNVRRDLAGDAKKDMAGKPTGSMNMDALEASQAIKRDADLSELASTQDARVESAIMKDKFRHPFNKENREQFYDNELDEPGVSTTAEEYARREKPFNMDDYERQEEERRIEEESRREEEKQDRRRQEEEERKERYRDSDRDQEQEQDRYERDEESKERESDKNREYREREERQWNEREEERSREEETRRSQNEEPPIDVDRNRENNYFKDNKVYEIENGTIFARDLTESEMRAKSERTTKDDSLKSENLSRQDIVDKSIEDNNLTEKAKSEADENYKVDKTKFDYINNDNVFKIDKHGNMTEADLPEEDKKSIIENAKEIYEKENPNSDLSKNKVYEMTDSGEVTELKPVDKGKVVPNNTPPVGSPVNGTPDELKSKIRFGGKEKTKVEDVETTSPIIEEVSDKPTEKIIKPSNIGKHEDKPTNDVKFDISKEELRNQINEKIKGNQQSEHGQLETEVEDKSNDISQLLNKLKGDKSDE